LVTKAFVSISLKKDSRFSKTLSVFLPVVPVVQNILASLAEKIQLGEEK
jgi:hypothetical protein